MYALKGKGSTNEVSIYFSWCDNDKIRECVARQTRSGWILECDFGSVKREEIRNHQNNNLTGTKL